MNFAVIQRCILSTSKGNVCFNVYKKISTGLISYDKTLIKPALFAKVNLQFNRHDLLHTNKVQYEKAQSNPKLVVDKKESNYSSIPLKKRPKKRTNSLSDKQEPVGVSCLKSIIIFCNRTLYFIIIAYIRHHLFILVSRKELISVNLYFSCESFLTIDLKTNCII